MSRPTDHATPGESSAPNATVGRDLTPDEFRDAGHRLIDWIADFLAHPERHPVLSRVAPGEIRGQLPASAPGDPAPFDEILEDFERILVPGLTQWNHPGFLAYFPDGNSAIGTLADLLSTAMGQQAMLWRTSPAATELEEVTLGWLRRELGLPDAFEGVIYDTASTSTLHALAAARELRVDAVRELGLAARALPEMRVYCSDQTHSSVEKAAIVLGFGHRAVRKIQSDRRYRMDPEALAIALKEDLAAGHLPVAVVATVGTTSSGAVDPVPAIAEACRASGVWLHVDAAYAGSAALVPERRWILDGCDLADSIVVNPHKWLFTPFDLSAFFCRRMDVLAQAFALTPEYLRTSEAGDVRNLMDTGFQLGRRFRALKLWMVMRHFGVGGLRAQLAEHIRLAARFAALVDDSPSFERLADATFSLVCFRARPVSHAGDEAALDRLNAALMDRINAAGEIFLSHTRLDGRFTLRLAIGHLGTDQVWIDRAWRLLNEHLDALADP